MVGMSVMMKAMSWFWKEIDAVKLAGPQEQRNKEIVIFVLTRVTLFVNFGVRLFAFIV